MWRKSHSNASRSAYAGMVAALLAISACSAAQNSASKSEGASTKLAASNGYTLRSNVTGASLVRLAELPSTTPLPIEPESNCAHFIQPASAGGRLAARKSWRLLQEQLFYQFQAVLIVRGGDPLTSGRCNYIDANVAFFEGERLIGILYPKGKDGIRIAGMEVVDGHLRIWSTDPSAQGQVNLKGTNLSFDEVKGSDSVCNGKFHVPVVFGQPYPQARPTLIASGWSARPSKEEMPADQIEYRRRFPELDSCAGTGYGECGFTLIAADGVTKLFITTLGGIDDMAVSSYEVACDGKPAE